MSNITTVSAYQSTILTLQSRWLEVQKIQDEEKRESAFFELLDNLHELEDLLTEITSSIELWVMDQPDDLLADTKTWVRTEKFIQRVQQWQHQIHRAAMSISNINNFMLFDAQGVDQAFAVLVALPGKP